MSSETAVAIPKRPTPLWLLLGLAVALLGWRMAEPLGRDQDVFYLLGRELWHGHLPYRDLFEHKPPGVLLVYAVAALLDDGDGWAIGLLDTLAAGATAAALFAVVQSWRDRQAAWLVAHLYLLCGRAPCFGGWWNNGQPEAFQDLAVALALLAGQRQRWLLAGVAVWSALLLKFTYIGLVPVFLVWAGRAGAARVLAGLTLPSLAALGLAAALGVLQPAWDAVIRFNLRHAQVSAIPWPRLPTAFLRGLGNLAAGIPVALLGGLALLRPQKPVRWLPLGLLLAAILQVLLQRKLWLWHWNPLVLPLILALAASLPTALAARRKRLALLLAVLALPTVFAFSQQLQRRFTSGNRAEVLARYTWGRGDFSALEVASVGMTLRGLAQPTDQLLVWGFEPGVYLASGLSPGTRWIYDYPLTVGLAPDARDAAIRVVLTQLPAIRWWVVFHGDRNALEKQESRAQLAQIPALQAALDRDYRLVETLADAEIYQRR